MGDQQRSVFRQWMLCFVVCNFNVDIGPEIEYIYPPDTVFSQPDALTICFNSFPERQDGDIAEDMYFSFNLRNRSPDLALFSPSPPYGSASLLHAAAVFRQEFDASTKRNFNQKSLALVSTHEFPAFFMTLLRIIVQDANIGDVARLEAACSQVAAWTSPRVGRQELPFLGEVIDLDIPIFKSFPLSGNPSPASATTSLVHSLSATDPTESWHTLFASLASPMTLHLAYELLLLGDAVIVLGHSPRQVSAMCTAILDLIRPIPYAGTIRPYMPMQSAGSGGDMGLFDENTRQSFVVGVTNPFLLQRYSHVTKPVPYILDLASTKTGSHHRSSSNAGSESKGFSLKSAKSIARRRSVSSSSANHKIDIPGTTIRGQAQVEQYIKPVKAFLSNSDGSKEHGRTAGVLDIRRHFTDVTARLLAPIHRFLATTSAADFGGQTLQPKRTDRSRDHHGQASQHFPLDLFLAYLSTQDEASLFVGQTSHGRHKSREAFYTRFCSSDNFRLWLETNNEMQRQMNAGVFD